MRFEGLGLQNKEGNLKGKVAIVTGASRGLGKAIAIQLARAGASVAVAARTVEAGQSPLPGTIHETVHEIEKGGGRSISVRCDVTREKDVEQLIRHVTEQFGRVDIMINNAGITTPEPFLKLSTKKWDLVMNVNLKGTFLCTKAVLPQMVERGSGHIINVSSVLAKRIQFSIPYGASKAAIERFTLGLAKEMKKDNVAVNVLCPDFTVTEAVTTFLKDVDTTGWQSSEMWGEYAVMVAAQDAESLTGKILDEPALREIFGPLESQARPIL
jgi:NAD(P)-dependent dehydrogenase (short-subunit alcohol dehydrogenase family)